MSASPRAARITKLVTSVKKHYKPVAPSKDRTLMDNLLYACLLENSGHAAADKVFQRLKDEYFDWNEVRVSTRGELAQQMKELNDPNTAADRLKRTLQSLFEAVYTFDLEHLKKQNLGQTVKQFQSYKGITPFVIAYATQTSLGGHSIPVNKGLFVAFQTLKIVTESEAKAGAAPGLERAIPKSKGVEVGSLLHQLGVEVGKNPYGQNARKILLAIDPSCKEQLPKRPAKPAPKKKAKTAKKKVASADAKQAAPKKGAPQKPAPKKAPTKKPAASGKKTPAKPSAAKKPPTKKTTPKKAVKKTSGAAAARKKTVKKKVKKTSNKRKPK